MPLYNSAETLAPLLEELAAIPIEGGLEIVLVNDGSRDATEAMAMRLIQNVAVPVTFLSLSRNFGEHNAGLRASTAEFVVTMDDDLQNPPFEVPKRSTPRERNSATRSTASSRRRSIRRGGISAAG